MLGIHNKTAVKYATTEHFPESRSDLRWKLAPYLPFLQSQWATGEYNIAFLYQTIRAQGYSGSERYSNAMWSAAGNSPLGTRSLVDVVAAEVIAGARDRDERRLYDQFFERCRRLGLIVTPHDEAWRTCGRMLSRYRQRYGDIGACDHENDVRIALAEGQLLREDEGGFLTEKDAL